MEFRIQVSLEMEEETIESGIPKYAYKPPTKLCMTLNCLGTCQLQEAS